MSLGLPAATASNPPSAPGLLTGAIEVRGDWHAPPASAALVVSRMRDACLDDLRLLSDHQPRGIYVENHGSGPPAIWLHTTPAETAWIITNVGERAWCQLSYQFGHELGHVFCNSWQPGNGPLPPCQWLEETLVESFSMRGLSRLAASWAAQPPFPDDDAYSQQIQTYRSDLLVQYSDYAARESLRDDMAAWFQTQRAALSASNGLTEMARAAVPRVLAELEHAPELVEDYAALNRWPERTSLSLADYLRHWQVSCGEIGSPGQLPALLGRLLGET